MHEALAFVRDLLGEDCPAYDFDAAGGGAGASACKKQYQDKCPGGQGPEVEVCGGISCGGDDGSHLKGALPQCGQEAAVLRQNGQCDQGDGADDDADNYYDDDIKGADELADAQSDDMSDEDY